MGLKIKAYSGEQFIEAGYLYRHVMITQTIWNPCLQKYEPETRIWWEISEQAICGNS